MPSSERPSCRRNRWKRSWWVRITSIPFSSQALLGLFIIIVVWVFTIVPQSQPLEGALTASALNFELGAEHTDIKATYGLLAVPIKALTISGLPSGQLLQMPFRDERLNLQNGGVLELTAMGTSPMQFALALQSGIKVENLQPEGSDQLVIDLLPAKGKIRALDQSAISLTPPPPFPSESPSGDETSVYGALQAVFKEPGRTEKVLVAPDSQFSLPLVGATRLRLRMASDNNITVFEPNLSTQNVGFTTSKASLFDQAPIRLSTLRSGTLHLGRQEPLTLRQNQFLRINSPGISELTHLQIENGLITVEVVGETRRISTGLSPSHPTTVLQGTLLSRHLSPEQITSFYGFLAGVMSSLLLMLLKRE